MLAEWSVLACVVPLSHCGIRKLVTRAEYSLLTPADKKRQIGMG